MTPDEAKTLAEKIHRETYCIEIEVMDGGKLPCKAHKTDAGFDLFATDDVYLEYGVVSKHPLNIKMKLPKGCFARIDTKSGLGSKGMLVYAGIIDEGYRGIPHVVCTSLCKDNVWIPDEDSVYSNDYRLRIKKGQKMAQMLMEPHSSEFYIEQVEHVSEDTDRGTGGFGSSGAK